MSRWDNRRSGRTTKMLAAAMRQCFNGGTSYVVIPHGSFEYCVPLLKDLGATYICKYRRFAEFGKGSKIEFVTYPGDDRVNEKYLEVRGAKEENTFWDHEVVRRAHNRAIMKYHEYD